MLNAHNDNEHDQNDSVPSENGKGKGGVQRRALSTVDVMAQVIS